MLKKTVKAEVLINFIGDREPPKDKIDKLIIQVENNLNSLPSQMLADPDYTGFVATRFHFREEIKPIKRDK